MSSSNFFESMIPSMRTAGMFAVACALGLGAVIDTATAQTTSQPRRPSTGGSSGQPAPTSTPTTTSPTTGEHRYMSWELDKPVDEFIMGPTAYPQPQGQLQFSVGGGLGMEEGGMNFNQLRARAEYGITNQFEVRAELPVTFSDQAGTTELSPTFDQIGLGALYNLTPMNDPMMISAAVDVDIPLSTGSQSGVADEILYKPALLAGYDFGPTEVHANLQGVLGGAARGLNFDIGGAYSTGALVPTFELNARAIENAGPQVYATPGLFYNFSNRVEVGVGVPIGLNDRSSTSIMAKLNVQLP